MNTQIYNRLWWGENMCIRGNSFEEILPDNFWYKNSGGISSDGSFSLPLVQGRRTGLHMVSLRDFLYKYGGELRDYYEEDFYVRNEEEEEW